MFGKHDFSETSLNDYFTIQNGYAFSSSEYTDGGIRVIRISNVQRGEIVDKNPVFVEKVSEEFLLQENDILVSLTGDVGRVGLLTKKFLPAALNQRVACLRRRREEDNIDYLFAALNNDTFEQDCVESANSGLGRNNLSTEWLKRYKIPSPDKKIATAFADYVRSVDKLKFAIHRKNTPAKTHRG